MLAGESVRSPPARSKSNAVPAMLRHQCMRVNFYQCKCSSVGLPSQRGRQQDPTTYQEACAWLPRQPFAVRGPTRQSQCGAVRHWLVIRLLLNTETLLDLKTLCALSTSPLYSRICDTPPLITHALPHIHASCTHKLKQRANINCLSATPSALQHMH